MNAKTEKQSYEPSATPHPWLIAGGVIGYVLFAAVAMGVLYLFLNAAAPERPFRVATFGQPRLQIDPAEDLRRLDEKQREKLNRIEWRDRKAGVLTIPIDAAMGVITARGPSAYDPLPAATALPSGKRPPGAMAPPQRQPNPGSGPSDSMQERP